MSLGDFKYLGTPPNPPGRKIPAPLYWKFLYGSLMAYAPPFWIPAFAGMTEKRPGMTERNRRDGDKRAGMTIWGAGFRPPAGMTGKGRRMTVKGRRMTGCVCWMPAFGGMTIWGAGPCLRGNEVGAGRTIRSGGDAPGYPFMAFPGANTCQCMFHFNQRIGYDIMQAPAIGENS